MKMHVTVSLDSEILPKFDKLMKDMDYTRSWYFNDIMVNFVKLYEEEMEADIEESKILNVFVGEGNNGMTRPTTVAVMDVEK